MINITKFTSRAGYAMTLPCNIKYLQNRIRRIKTINETVKGVKPMRNISYVVGFMVEFTTHFFLEIRRAAYSVVKNIAS